MSKPMSQHETLTLPVRNGPPPKTESQPPHLQLSDRSPPDIHAALCEFAFGSLDHVREMPTLISVPSSRALWLDERMTAPAKAFMPPRGSREFAHVHADGSLHAVLDPASEAELLAKGWGEPHPWKHRGVNEMMVYAPRDREELEVVKSIIRASWRQAAVQA